MSMAASRLLLSSSALGLCLTLTAPAVAADEQRLNSIMNPAIMSQMVMLDEPVSAPAEDATMAAGQQLAQNDPEPVVQTQAPVLYDAPIPSASNPQPSASQMSKIIPEHTDTPLATPPGVREVAAPATSQATPPPDMAKNPLPEGVNDTPVKPLDNTALATAKPQDVTIGADMPKTGDAAKAQKAIARDYGIPATDAAQGKRLSLEEVIARAIKNSPERDIAAEQVNQAISAVDEARSNYFPQVSTKLEAGREYNDPFANSAGALNKSGANWGAAESLNLRQMVYDGFITRETVKQRMDLVESSKLSRAKITEELIKSTAEVYMELYQFQQVVVASKENLDALHEIAKLIDLRVKAGDASKAEQNYMQARVASAEQTYITSQAALKDAFSALVYLIGPTDEFEAIAPDMGEYVASNPDDIVEKATTRSTEIRLVNSDQKAAAHDLQSAKGRFMPEVDIVMDGEHSDDLGGFTGSRDYGSAKVQVSYKLFDGGLRSATTQRQYAKIREVEAREGRVKREVTQAVSRDYNKQQTTVKEMKVADDEIVANTDLEKLYRKQFKSGDIDITNLVESQERIYSARMKKYKLESDFVNVTFSILRSTAEMLPKFCGNTTGC